MNTTSNNTILKVLQNYLLPLLDLEGEKLPTSDLIAQLDAFANDKNDDEQKKHLFEKCGLNKKAISNLKKALGLSGEVIKDHNKAQVLNQLLRHGRKNQLQNNEGELETLLTEIHKTFESPENSHSQHLTTSPLAILEQELREHLEVQENENQEEESQNSEENEEEETEEKLCTEEEENDLKKQIQFKKMSTFV